MELYNLEQRYKAIKSQYEKKKKSLALSIKNYMYANGFDFFDFESENGRMAVRKSSKKQIVWNIEKLEKRLGKDICNEFIDKEYKVTDMDGLVKYLKSCGVNPKKFKQYIEIQKSVNQEALNQLSEIGDITSEDVKGCFEIKESDSYLRLGLVKEEEKEDE